MALTASNTASCTIAPYRAWANGFCLFATNVSTASAFQSVTTSACVTALLNRTQVATIRTAGNLALDLVFASCMAVFLPQTEIRFGSQAEPSGPCLGDLGCGSMRWS